MLLEHKAPFLHVVEKSLSERTQVHTEPFLEDDAALDRLNFLVDCLVRVNLPSAETTQREILH